MMGLRWSLRKQALPLGFLNMKFLLELEACLNHHHECVKKRREEGGRYACKMLIPPEYGLERSCTCISY